MLTSSCGQSAAFVRQLQGGAQFQFGRRLVGMSDGLNVSSLKSLKTLERRILGNSLTCQTENARGPSDTSTEFDNLETKTAPPQPKRKKGFGGPTPHSMKPKVPESIAAEPKAEAIKDRARTGGPQAAGVRRRPAPEKPLVLATVSETDTQIETLALGLLGVLFVLIFAEGIFLGASGFLSKEWDDFAVTVVYPAFTPTVGAFLLVAASYGVFKYLQGGASLPGPPPE